MRVRALQPRQQLCTTLRALRRCTAPLQCACEVAARSSGHRQHLLLGLHVSLLAALLGGMPATADVSLPLSPRSCCAGHLSCIPNPVPDIACWHTDGGTPVTYPGSGTSFMLPLSPPYNTATVVLCGATWGYNNVNGASSLHKGLTIAIFSRYPPGSQVVNLL